MPLVATWSSAQRDNTPFAVSSSASSSNTRLLLRSLTRSSYHPSTPTLPASSSASGLSPAGLTPLGRLTPLALSLSSRAILSSHSSISRWKRPSSSSRSMSVWKTPSFVRSSMRSAKAPPCATADMRSLSPARSVRFSGRANCMNLPFTCTISAPLSMGTPSSHFCSWMAVLVLLSCLTSLSLTLTMPWLLTRSRSELTCVASTPHLPVVSRTSLLDTRRHSRSSVARLSHRSDGCTQSGPFCSSTFFSIDVSYFLSSSPDWLTRVRTRRLLGGSGCLTFLALPFLRVALSAVCLLAAEDALVAGRAGERDRDCGW
mmetsp:Transcript_18578/g.53096  ORF Transcript_18578/g.53096 Transcript_18578/m.53096 type:complete len:316 (-) Transcript_18578:264-1211(-)